MAAEVNEEEKNTTKMTVSVVVPRPRDLRYAPEALKIVTLEVCRDDTVASVKATLHDMEGIPPCRQRLEFAGSALPDDDDTTLGEHGVVDSATIQLVETKMQVFVRCMHRFDGPRTITFSGLESSDTVESFRLRVQEREGILLRPVQQRLVRSGKQMEDGHTLADYDVGDGSTVELLYRPVRQRYREVQLDIEVTDTVGRIKELVEEAEGVPVACQSVSYCAKKLDDCRALADYDALEWVHIECRRHETLDTATNTMTKGNPSMVVEKETIKNNIGVGAVERKPFRAFLIGPELAAICSSSCDTDPDY